MKSNLQKRRTYTKRDLGGDRVKRDLPKRPTCMKSNLQKRLTYMKRDLQDRPTYVENDPHIWKITNIYGR